MTTESNHNDPRVSEAYRRIATETTPPELDRTILAMAAGKSRSRYGLARAWIRPVAWAATIGLSLAFLLEISQVRDASTVQPDTDRVETLEEVVIRDETPAPARLSVPAAKQASSPPAVSEPAPIAEAGLARGDVSVSDEFEADDLSMLHEAEEQARARSGSEQAAAEALSFDAAVTFEKKEQDAHCAPDIRSSAESWFACIKELRDGGLSDAADTELLALLTEFPDFEEPEQHR